MDILIIKSKVKEFIKLLYICPHYRVIMKKLNNKTSKIVLFGTPAHGNLGDQAIAISEIDFLTKYSRNRTVVEIPMPLYKTHRESIKKLINSEDTIVISGGGWMGNLWIHNEITIREIVSDYKKNRIVIFPQTLFYTDNREGEQTVQNTKAIFSGHSDLFLIVRDFRSLKFAETHLGFKIGKNCFFCPDMVVFGTLAQKIRPTADKKIALVCLRNDIEKSQDTNYIINILKEASYCVKDTTTVLNHLVPIRKRRQVVENKIREFQVASLVVTDRLHAMLFSVLSGTPCIAFDNISGKVFGVGEYLKRSGMPIYLLDKLELSDIQKIECKKQTYILPDELNHYFLNLVAIINNKGITPYEDS